MPLVLIGARPRTDSLNTIAKFEVENGWQRTLPSLFVFLDMGHARKSLWTLVGALIGLALSVGLFHLLGSRDNEEVLLFGLLLSLVPLGGVFGLILSLRRP